MSSEATNRIVRPTVSLPADIDEAIEERLDYGDSKSDWIREACEMRLAGDERRNSQDNHE